MWEVQPVLMITHQHGIAGRRKDGRHLPQGAAIERRRAEVGQHARRGGRQLWRHRRHRCLPAHRVGEYARLWLHLAPAVGADATARSEDHPFRAPDHGAHYAAPARR